MVCRVFYFKLSIFSYCHLVHFSSLTKFSSYICCCGKKQFYGWLFFFPSFPLLLGFGLLLQVRMDPRNNTDYESLWYEKILQLTEEDLKGQEGGYMYRYRYNGGGATQVWLSSSRYILWKCNWSMLWICEIC